MQIRTLENLSFDEIIDCFLRAFGDYMVKMPEDPEYYYHRWKAAGLNYEMSFGAFENNRLVGFILHCIDTRNGHTTAFNTGTGVIPEFRGNRIISAIYDQAIPKIKGEGITKSSLEVIQTNTKALNIYLRNGFVITRDYRCFQGKLRTQQSPTKIRAISFDEIDWKQMPNQHLQSWDHQKNSLINGPYQYYEVFSHGEKIGFFALNPGFGYLALIENFSSDPNNWDPLISSVGELAPQVKINNVDSRLVDKIQALEQGGLKNTINQYEMELSVA